MRKMLSKAHQKLEYAKNELEKEKANSNKLSQEKTDVSNEHDDSQVKLHKQKTETIKNNRNPKSWLIQKIY